VAQSGTRTITPFMSGIKENYRTVSSVLTVLPKQNYGCIKIALNILLVLQEMSTLQLSEDTKIDQPLSMCKFIFSVDS